MLLTLIFFLLRQNVFVGAEEGLYYINLFDELDNEPKAHVKDFGAINQIQMIESLQMLIVIAGGCIF